jgi:thiopeptide-type bacteriocin biosynthesis protein
MEWSSIHIYMEYTTAEYGSIVRHLLTPMCERSASELGATRFFFINYSENGPHLRVRIGSEKMALVDNFVYQFAEQFFKSGPLTPRSVRMIREVYEPELNRYFGPDGLVLCERHFQLSTTCIFELFQSREYLTNSELLKTMMYMQLGMLSVFDIKNLVRFYQMLLDYWLPVIVADKQRAQLLQGIENFYQSQKENIALLMNSVMENIYSHQTFAEPWFNRWISGNRELYAAFVAGGLDQYKHADNPILQRYLAVENEEGWKYAICDSLLHMNNNRLGASNNTEVIVQYLMMRVFKEKWV